MRSINNNAPLTRETLEALKLNTLYEFQLRSGQKQLIRFMYNRNDTLTGYYFDTGPDGKEAQTPYASSYDEVMQHVVSISIRKVNVAATITVSVLAYVTTLAIVFSSIWESSDCFICWIRPYTIPNMTRMELASLGGSGVFELNPVQSIEFWS
jgi:hypothetical protein